MRNPRVVLLTAGGAVLFMILLSGRYKTSNVTPSRVTLPRVTPNQAKNGIDSVSDRPRLPEPEVMRSASANREVRTMPLPSDDITQCKPEQRLRALRDACSRYNTSRLVQRFGHHFLYVSDKHKYVACLPLKAGCSTWKTILVNNTLEQPLPSAFTPNALHVNGLKRYKIYRLDSYSKEDQKRILDTHYKFMVTRHPLDRLASGYNDKIFKGEFMNIRKSIIRMRQRTHNDSSYDITAFLEFILHQKLAMDQHWYPTTALCDPCNVHYDKIVKLETQKIDLLDVVPHLGPYGRVRNVYSNHQGTGAASQFTWLRDAFQNVPEQLLQDVLGLGYDIDMDLFGYSFKTKTIADLELKCQYDNLNCC